MRHGLAYFFDEDKQQWVDNSYGKSKTANFLDGGGKAGIHFNLGKGHAFMLGGGYELKTPAPRTAFQAEQMNNDFVRNLKNEKVLSAEASYQLKTSLIKLNINGYYSRLKDVTEQSMFYNDNYNTFTYVSLTGIEKEYYGVEVGSNATPEIVVSSRAFPSFPCLISYPMVTPNMNSPVVSACPLPELIR